MIVKYFSIPHTCLTMLGPLVVVNIDLYSNMTVVVVICDVKFLMQRVTCSSGA